MGWKHVRGQEPQPQGESLNRTIVGWKLNSTLPSFASHVALNRTIVGWKLEELRLLREELRPLNRTIVGWKLLQA